MGSPAPSRGCGHDRLFSGEAEFARNRTFNQQASLDERSTICQ